MWIKDPGGNGSHALWLALLLALLTLCAVVSVFLLGLFLEGFVPFLHLCSFRQALSAGHWLETAALTMIIGAAG